MARNKYDFIKELLEDKRIKQNQRERILELASREISLEGTLEERVQKIEEILFNKQAESMVPHDEGGLTWHNIEVLFDQETESVETAINPTFKEINLPKYLNPSHLYNFLFQYNY